MYQKRFVAALSIFLFLFVMIGSGCNTKEPVEAQPNFNFYCKNAIRVTEDGWVYFFNHEWTKEHIEEASSSYLYGAYNLKYKHLDGYDIPMINHQTGEVMQYLEADMPYLACNQNADKEIRALSDFLQKKAFQAPITAADLDGLKFNYIDRDDVVSLFNQMITSENLPEGKYGYLPEASIKQEESLLSGYRWQVGQFGCLGNIQQLDIELLYEDDIHLSDLVKEGKATEEQKKIQEKIEQIEAKILKEQNLLAAEEENKETLGGIRFERLQTLLQKVENTNKEGSAS